MKSKVCDSILFLDIISIQIMLFDVQYTELDLVRNLHPLSYLDCLSLKIENHCWLGQVYALANNTYYHRSDVLIHFTFITTHAQIYRQKAKQWYSFQINDPDNCRYNFIVENMQPT